MRTSLAAATHDRVDPGGIAGDLGIAAPLQKLACLMPSEYAPVLRSRPQRLRLAHELRSRYESGASIRALADSTCLAYGTIRRLLIEAGAAMRPRGGAYARTTARTDLVTRVRDALELLDGTLPRHLLNVAHLRLEYPEATFQQLAALASPPMSAAAVYAQLISLLRRAERVRHTGAHQ